MEQNQGVDEILGCLRVSFRQLYNLFLSQPHKDERFMWESCQQKYTFTGKFGLKKNMVDMTTDVKLPWMLTCLIRYILVLHWSKFQCYVHRTSLEYRESLEKCIRVLAISIPITQTHLFCQMQANSF